MSELYSSGVEFIDEVLGGGLQPGTLTVVRGATGIGKTQFGLSFSQAGLTQEGQRGIILDLGSRGDSQQHAPYARRLFNWDLQPGPLDLGELWGDDFQRADYLNPFGYDLGLRVLRDETNEDLWRTWRARLNESLRQVLAYCYAHFVHGVRRVLVDGIEPFGAARDSLQIELFEYILHQILRKPYDWVARDLFQGHWNEVKDQVLAHPYDSQALEDDLTTNATTVILLGRLPAADRVERGLFVLKHRGGWCSDEITRFTITATGLQRSS